MHPNSLKNLRPGVRKGRRDGKVRLTLRVLPATKRWLEAQGKIGDAVDRLVLEQQRRKGFMLGVFRLVNPNRGLIYCAEIESKCGLLTARTNDFQRFYLYSVQGGLEFYPGRSFERKELAQWLLGEPLHPDQRERLSDEFGDIPALSPNPQSWVWFAMGMHGEERLKRQFKPTAAEIQALAGAALSLSAGQFFPLIDPFEVWLCDKDSLLPVALAMTGSTLEDVLRQTFSPRWRANWQYASEENEGRLRDLEKQVNERINSSDSPRTWRWVDRLFRRNLDGSSEEFNRDGERVAEFPPGFLPAGLLAEPFESERLRLEEAL